MNACFFIVVMFTIFSSCQKNNADDMKTNVELLTQKTWILSGYGYDENNNGMIDPFEELIKDCEKDNTYLLSKDGSGIYQDNQISCGNGIDESVFKWKLINGNEAIDFLFGRAIIKKLNESEFVIYYDVENSNGQHNRFYTILKH